MTMHTFHLFLPGIDSFWLTGFIASSTLLSYSLHWYLLNGNISTTSRIKWTVNNKTTLILLAITGAIGAAFFFYYLHEYWFQLIIPAFITMIYTAPKISVLNKLKSIAYGKTFLLAFTWAYVTVILPLWIYASEWEKGYTVFFISRFSLIYLICLLFDFRDRKEDMEQGLTTLPSRITLRGLRIVFYSIMTFFLISTLMLLNNGFEVGDIMILLIPGIILALIFPICTRNFNDYIQIPWQIKLNRNQKNCWEQHLMTF
jgi:glucose-6-phosphate-specific signal transduction histidine kinase